MKRIAEITMVACFLGLLIAGLVTTATRKPELISYWENRMLAAFPKYSPQPIGDGSYAAQIEEYLSDHAAARTTLLKVKTRIDLALHRPVVNDVVVTENSLLPYLPYETVDLAMLDVWAGSMADRLKQISDTVSKNGGYFCYVAVPCQSVSRSGEYPWYLNNQEQFNRQKGAALSKAMEARAVAFLDVQAALIDTSAYASQVDNHYSMEGAFMTYRLIMEKIEADTGLDFPMLGEDDFVWETLSQDYMGSRERKLLNTEQRDERLSILLPKREVSYTRVDNGMPCQSFVYDLPATEVDQVTYNLYMGGDIANTIIDTGREKLPTILIYGDSFTNPVECLAYLSFDEMHSLDLRHYRDTSLEHYIQQLRPEVVVCIRDYDFLLEPAGNGGN